MPSIDGIEPRLEARTPARSVADARDRTATHYRLSPLETSEPLVYPALQPATAGPKETARPQLPAAPPTPTLGARDSFMSSRAQEAMAEPAPALLPPGDLAPVVPHSSQAAPGAEQGDVMAQMRERLNELTESVERCLQTEPSGAGQTRSLMPAPETYELPSGTKPNVGGSGGALRAHEPRRLRTGAGIEMLTPARTGVVSDGVDYRGQTGFESAQRPGLDVSRKKASLPYPSSTPSPVEMSGQARRIMGTHKSRQSFSNDKFNRHMLAAEDHLSAHRYYKAVDSFTLALIYGPDDPQALMGRSRALFAAGEYVSSALFLCRALAIRPDYAKSRIDLVTLLGDRSRLAARIADLEQWSAKSGSPQLGLLLGYVYLQTGRFSEAAKTVEAADVKTPNSGDFAAAKAAIAAAVR
jgi:tetratricopeptide (TPR) repeat protein